MPVHLIVTMPFANKKTGDRISDPDEVARIRASHLIKHVVPINLDEPLPEKVAHKVDLDKLAAAINGE